MVTVCPLHKYYTPAHLDHVKREMTRLGPPRLRGYLHTDGVWYMREGTHRLRAAHALGVSPVLVPIPWWRSRRSLERAQFAAIEYGHTFPRVRVHTPRALDRSH